MQYVPGLALKRGRIGHGGLPGSFDDDTRSDRAQRPIRPRTLELRLLRPKVPDRPRAKPFSRSKGHAPGSSAFRIQPTVLPTLSALRSRAPTKIARPKRTSFEVPMRRAFDSRLSQSARFTGRYLAIRPAINAEPQRPASASPTSLASLSAALFAASSPYSTSRL